MPSTQDVEMRVTQQQAAADVTSAEAGSGDRGKEEGEVDDSMSRDALKSEGASTSHPLW